MHFLTICWNLIAYGSAFFTGYVRKVLNLLWHYTLPCTIMVIYVVDSVNICCYDLFVLMVILV